MPTFLTRFNHASFGIDTIYSLNADLELFSREVVREALERGIDPSKPSDALDASRDVILADAAHALGLYHQFYEDNLCIYPQGFEVDWEQFFLDREER